MRFRNSLFVTLGGLSALIAGPSHAQDFCDSLKQAIQAAPSQFTKYKGSWDSDAEFYNTSWTIDGASGDDCALSHDEHSGNSLSCDWTASSYSEASEEVEALSERVESCLKPGPYEARSWSERDRPGLRYSSKSKARIIIAPVNDTYDVSIYVSGGCRMRHKTGVEKCQTSVTLDLEGDDRD